MKKHLLALLILGVFASVAKAQTDIRSGTIDAGLVEAGRPAGGSSRQAN